MLTAAGERRSQRSGRTGVTLPSKRCITVSRTLLGIWQGLPGYLPDALSYVMQRGATGKARVKGDRVIGACPSADVAGNQSTADLRRQESAPLSQRYIAGKFCSQAGQIGAPLVFSPIVLPAQQGLDLWTGRYASVGERSGDPYPRG
jgi:hypothetical protein